MDFKKSPQGRFKSLAGERKNPFSSNREHRNTTPSSTSSGGKYVPPSKREKKKNRRNERLRLPEAEERRKAPTPPPDTTNAELFPSLGSLSNSEVKSSVVVEQKEEVESKPSFAAITGEKEESPVTSVEKEPLKPGWVRLFRGPNGEFMQERGPPVPESDFFKRMREHEERKAREQLLETLERHIAYAREMDPYYDSYHQEYDEDDCDDYESDHEYVEEYVSDDEDYDY